MNICTNDIFSAAEPFVTKLAIMMYDHEPVSCWSVRSNLWFPGGTPMLGSINQNQKTVDAS